MNIEEGIVRRTMLFAHRPTAYKRESARCASWGTTRVLGVLPCLGFLATGCWAVPFSGGVESETDNQTLTGTATSDDTETETDTGQPDDSPVIVELGVSVPALSDGESVTFTATVVDPDGPDDILGGVLKDPINPNISYDGFTKLDNGIYSITLTWEQIHQAADISFIDAGEARFVADFSDHSGNKDTENITLPLTCKGFSGLSGACDGVCRDLTTKSNCGSCGLACGTDVCNSQLTCDSCGNGVFEPSSEELCDDGNATEQDGCDNDCLYSSPIKNISLGNNHSCLLTDGGGIKCWGHGSFLGYGNTDKIGDDEAPADVGLVTLESPALELAVGHNHACAVLTTGVKCWGSYSNGLLGYGNNNNNSIGDDELLTDVGFVDVGGTVINIAAGDSHTCAVLDGGSVRCWGNGSYGKLGYESTNHVGDNEDPVDAGSVKLAGVAKQVSVGGSFSCALLDQGTVKCWGSPYYLGTGDTETSYGDLPNSMPPPETPLGGVARDITSGSNHTCALLDGGDVVCWGGSYLGYPGGVDEGETPADVGPVNLGSPAIAVAAGDYYTCAVVDNGDLYCWGQGGDGKLGYGNLDHVGQDETPAQRGPVKLGGAATAIATGAQHTCAMLTNGSVKCWGRNTSGQLGYGHTDTLGDGLNDTPDLVPPVELF